MKHCRIATGSKVAICVLLFVGTLLVPAGYMEASEKTFTLSELRQERKNMAQRKRRIIFNNDGDDFEGHGGRDNNRTDQTAAMTSTPAGLLELRTTALLGSQVDTISYSSVYGLKLMYQESAFKTIYEFPDRKPERRKIAVANCKALMANYGMDNLEVMINCAREHGLEIFYSNRMNDNHDWYFPEFLSAIKVRHPEYTIGHADANTDGTQTPEETLRLMRQGKQGETALNFGLPVIRDLTVEAMREICRNYDIDGIDLDYFRFFKLFPSPVGPEQVEQLTDMMRKMREMTEEEGLRRDRPILISARGILNPERMLKGGLDFETWLKEDLIDVVTLIHIKGHQGSLKEFYDLAHRYKAPAYANVRYHRAYQHTWEACRGEAMFRFLEGADGITTFNRFDPTHRMWWELGDPHTLRDLDKTYTCPQHLPVTVTDTDSGPLRLLVGEDVTSDSPAKEKKSVTLRVHVTGLTAQHDLQIKLNGQELELAASSPALSDQPQDVMLDYLPELTLFQVSENRVTASVTRIEETVKIDDVQLDVLYLD